MERGTYRSFKEIMIRDSQKYTPNFTPKHWLSTRD